MRSHTASSMMLARQNTPGVLPAVGYTPTRGFFGRKKKEETPAEEETKAPKEDGDKTAEPNAEGEQQHEEEKEAAQAEGAGSQEKEEKKTGGDGKEEVEDTASGDKEGSEDALSAKDVKRIKNLFNEQEEEIKNLEAKLKVATSEAKS